ncbi:MAG: GNAT family N-acetyltransferase [Gammaproteobacteria bacterium]
MNIRRPVHPGKQPPEAGVARVAGTNDTIVRFHAGMDEIVPDSWNALVDPRYPFLRHEFLAAAERHDCVSPETGWTPCHAALYRHDELLAALPLYEKTHSWGEFIFDWSWADAYRRAGLDYYPKLVSAVPFTPATGHRLLVRDEADRSRSGRALLQAVAAHADAHGFSSAHVLFPTPAELPALEASGFVLRKDCQFQWRNRGYENFDDFLSDFSSAKRKKARRERRRVAEAGIRFRNLASDELDNGEWSRVFRLCSYTFIRRGNLPYLSLEFFLELRETIPRSLRVIVAEHEGEIIAAAIFFRGHDTLYGRYWGSEDDYHSLHFETCYYQGIDYCIAEGISLFEPGTQGEHKIRRGFLPTVTWSAHRMADPRFAEAIRRYLDEEGRHVDDYVRAAGSHSPFRSDLGETPDAP